MATVFLIDDPAGNLEKLKLDRLECTLHVVPCVASALEFAQTLTPDLIVCMDPLHGLVALDLLEIKASDPHLRETAVAVIAETQDDKSQCYRLGCDEFIELGTDEEEILCRIKALLRRAEKSGLHGTFSHVSFVDVVQLLVASQRDGIMQVDTLLAGQATEARLYFIEGQVVHAIIGEQVGEEAFLTILRATRQGGYFTFLTGDDFTITPSIEKRTDHMLLGLATKLDEEN